MLHVMSLMWNWNNLSSWSPAYSRVGWSPSRRTSPSEHDSTIRVIIVPTAAPHLGHPVIFIVHLPTPPSKLCILSRKGGHTQRSRNLYLHA